MSWPTDDANEIEAVKVSARAASEVRVEDKVREADWVIPDASWSSEEVKDTEAINASANDAREVMLDDSAREAGWVTPEMS
jgi:hypothetical protein